jgi:hypothetical protein
MWLVNVNMYYWDTIVPADQVQLAWGATRCVARIAAIASTVAPQGLVLAPRNAGDPPGRPYGADVN